MTTFKKNDLAQYGLYASISPPDVRFVGSDGETLGGLENATYRRLPIILAIGLSPIIGGVFVMAFPLIVLGMFLWAVVSTIVNKIRESEVTNFKWEPMVSYLVKKKNK
jgi:hypothetical protein